MNCLYNLEGSIIANAISAKVAEKKIIEGVLQSALLSSEQRRDIQEGFVKSALPDKMRKKYDVEIKVNENKTKNNIGTVKLAGSKY